MPSTLQSHVDLPLIDISQFQSDSEYETLQNNPGLASVREACKDWGFFSITNHGIPTDLLQQMESQCRHICSVPAEAKKRAVNEDPVWSYIRAAKTEIFTFWILPESDSIKELSKKMWPEEGTQTNFSETFEKYSVLLQDLARKICKLILAGLGLDAEKFYNLHFEKCPAHMRIIHYLSEAKSVGDELLLPHTDIGCFTILYRDNESGLQVRSKEGEWLDMNPISNSFVVFIGDSIKAWSNGIYRSGEHRVLYKGWVDRFSAPYFVRFAGDKKIWAPDELLDYQHPRRYRPLISLQFEEDSMKYLKTEDAKVSNFFEQYAAEADNLNSSMKSHVLYVSFVRQFKRLRTKIIW